MDDNNVNFLLRLLLIAAFWLFIWSILEPKTQSMRILRAALLMLGMLGILSFMRIAGI